MIRGSQCSAVLRLMIVVGGNEGHFDNFSLNYFVSDFQLQFGPELGEVPWDVGHGNVPAQGGAWAARGDPGYALTVVGEYLGSRPGRRSLGGEQTDSPPGRLV